MRILVYKQTHIGDPDRGGVFGHADCMKRVRSIPFDAVIGVGGTGSVPMNEGINGCVTWVGLGPKLVGHAPSGHPIWKFYPFKRFEFRLMEDRGPLLRSVAPRLAERMYLGRARYLVNLSGAEQAEALRLIGTVLSTGTRAALLRAGVPRTPEACAPEKPCRTRRRPEYRRCR